ncbi:tyrosine-type recombinase/integrase [Nocardia sp. 2YAB30]|uniref:tyrosine-type recombinase/integrase n=1 Tax=Nocardia sp. 2YAB30 TaxID=3233022 RepID=UPI003F947B1F
MPTPRPRVRRDGTVVWQVPIRIARDGRVLQSSKSFPTLEAAIGWAQLVDKLGTADAVALLDFQRGSTVAPATVADWLNAYVDHLTGVEPYTKRKYCAYIVNDIAPFMGHLPLDAVTQFTDAAWVLHLEEKGNSGKTIANKHGFFAAAMAAAARMRPKPLIAYNPCIGTRLPRHDSPEMTFFEPDEYELFLSAMPQRWHAQTEFCLASMARPSEVAALTVGDIKRGAGAVRINKAFKYTGTGRKLGPPKTKRGVRTVNVPFETLDRLGLDRPHDALLFHTRRGTPIRPAYFYQEAFLPACAGRGRRSGQCGGGSVGR